MTRQLGPIMQLVTNLFIELTTIMPSECQQCYLAITDLFQLTPGRDILIIIQDIDLPAAFQHLHLIQRVRISSSLNGESRQDITRSYSVINIEYVYHHIEKKKNAVNKRRRVCGS